MTVSSLVTKIVYSGNGVARVFAIPFDYTDASEVAVYYTNTLGVLAKVTTNLEINIITNQVTYPVAVESLSIASGTKLTIIRETPHVQEVNLENQGYFTPSVIEQAFDKLTRMGQELTEKISRTIRYSLDETPSETDTESFLSSITIAKNQAQDSSDSASIKADEALASAASAEASLSSVATNATSASNSATAAASSAASAATSAATATTKASESATSAASALDSKNNAATSESNAATSATSAGISSTNAGVSAELASTKASEAVTSASNAATSETNASASATSASSSASSIGTLAVAALTSSSASIAISLLTNSNFSHTLTENTTLANPTNVTAGMSGQITFTQHASAAKTLGFGTNWISTVGTVPTISTTVGAENVLTYYAVSSTKIWYTLLKAGVA